MRSLRRDSLPTMENRIIQSSHHSGCLRSYRESRRRPTDTSAMTVTPVTVAMLHGCKSLELLAILEKLVCQQCMSISGVASSHIPRVSAMHDTEEHEQPQI